MEQTLIERLRTRANIRRKIPRGEPDRISDVLEEAANELERLEGLTRGEYICKRCGIRQDPPKIDADF